MKKLLIIALLIVGCANKYPVDLAKDNAVKYSKR